MVPLITTVPVVSPRLSRIVALETGPLTGIVWFRVLQLESTQPFEIGGTEGKGDWVLDARRTGPADVVGENVTTSDGEGGADFEDEGVKGDVAEGLAEGVGVGKTGSRV